PVYVDFVTVPLEKVLQILSRYCVYCGLSSTYLHRISELRKVNDYDTTLLFQ
uniref:Radical SAM protein n=1 Tax=Mesocestoides corti TaxID=53468 RepID=A0A5K3F8Q7_MESCO